MADTLVNTVENWSLEDVVTRQKKERKDFQSKIMQIKKAVPKGDKKRQKEMQLQVAQMETEFDQRCQLELSQVEAALRPEQNPQNEVHSETVSENKSLSAHKPSKAEKRREKKRIENIERQKEIDEQERINADLPRAIEERQFEEKLRAEGLQIYSIVPDGNCLFSAVAHQLKAYGQNFTAMNIRRECAKNLRENRSHFEVFVPDEDYSTYCDRIETDQTYWGGEVEVLALSNQFKCKIIIYQAEGANLVVGDASLQKKLLLSFHRHLIKAGEHYNSVVVETPPSDE